MNLIPNFIIFLIYKDILSVSAFDFYTGVQRTRPEQDSISESLNLCEHTQTVLSLRNFQTEHPSLLLYISLLPSLQSLLTPDSVCDMVLNPGKLLEEQQYTLVIGTLINRLDSSRDREILIVLKGRIKTLRYVFICCFFFGR